jgi:hypothetical protein
MHGRVEKSNGKFECLGEKHREERIARSGRVPAQFKRREGGLARIEMERSNSRAARCAESRRSADAENCLLAEAMSIIRSMEESLPISDSIAIVCCPVHPEF